MSDLSESQNPRKVARKERKTNTATGVSAASVRAIGSQALAFYFRAPAKAFFRTRIDYLAFARAINPHFQANEGYSLRISTPGLLSHAVKTYGWSFIPNHVLPPMLANIGIGAVLYTTYLQCLGQLYEPSSRSLKLVYPPPPIRSTFSAGFAAGTLSSIVAAPLDALAVRFKTSEILSGRYKTMWQYGFSKLREIGPRRVYAGWGLAFIKDSLGYGAFFAAFEFVKAQAYYGFVTEYYGKLRAAAHVDPLSNPRPSSSSSDDTLGSAANLVKPHWALAPAFLLLAGITASVAQQVIQHPITIIQNVHFKSLESLERVAHASSQKRPQAFVMRIYYDIYRRTYQQCKAYSTRAGGWRRWLYRGFLVNTIKQVPSTSAGLVIFELVRRKYGDESDAVVIETENGHDILLS